MLYDFTAIYGPTNTEYSFKAESFARALDFCNYKFKVEIKNLICETPTRRQQFVKVEDGTWRHLPYVGCSDADVITDINAVTLY
jgi:hypothetical protein